MRRYSMPDKIILVLRCAWTLYNFRAGLMCAFKQRGAMVIGGGAGGDVFEPRIAALGMPFISLPLSRRVMNPPADARLFCTLYRWYRRECPDVVHHSDFSARHSERPSKRASGSRAMKVHETKEALATISSACASRHDWHGGKPGSSKFQDAQIRLTDPTLEI